MYGFNGQEKDDEIAGSGNSNTAQFWQYDSRIGRRWNIDPVDKPWESSYAAFLGNPIIIVDPDGNDEIHFYYTKDYSFNEQGGIIVKVTVDVEIVENEDAHTFFIHRRYLPNAATGGVQFFPFKEGTNIAGKSFVAASKNFPGNHPLYYAFGLFHSKVDDHLYLGRLLNVAPDLIDHYKSKGETHWVRAFQGAAGRARSHDLGQTVITTGETVFAIVDGYYMVRGVFSWGKALISGIKNSPINITLGLKKEGFALKTASKNGSTYYTDWEKAGIYDPSKFEGWSEAFKYVTNKAINSGGRISFELGGMDIKKALTGDASIWVGRYTDWELQQITKSARLWNNTDFYLNGVQLTKKQVKKMGIKLNTD